ncbi:hypothetical protein EDD86DRAFT_202240 [Gorgonomyces haynaldii]|nr:hypothetical protein EDD86DRAFT_202240 [Gorgonomyces haynaldii]
MHDQGYQPVPPHFEHSRSFGDLLGTIDTQTMRRIPWNNNIPHFIVDFVDPDTMKPLDFCPRGLLKTILKKYSDLELFPMSGMEFEFFQFRESPQSLVSKNGVGLEPLSQGMFGYSLLRPAQEQKYFNQIYDDCLQYRIPLECYHTETGPGVYEAAIEYADTLELADRAHLFKTAVKQIGAQHGIVPCFMAKPYQNQPGCSGHIHFSLRNINQENLFYNPKGGKDAESLVTDSLRHFVAGILHGLPSIMAILAPTINSYKRLVANYWAPLTVSYGFEHRQTAVRIITPPVCSPSATRIEVRVPGADVNPYLASAAILACGLEGIVSKLEPPVQVSEPGSDTSGRPRLARSLQEAVVKMMDDNSFARKVLGNAFVDHYGTTRLHEVRNWSVAVTDYELKRYMETM